MAIVDALGRLLGAMAHRPPLAIAAAAALVLGGWFGAGSLRGRPADQAGAEVAASGTVVPTPFSRTPVPAITSSVELPTDGTGPPTTEDGIPMHVVGYGEFQGADDYHFARGSARLVEVAPGAFILQLEGLAVRNAPELNVYLSEEAGGYGGDVLRLGALTAPSGDFTYDVPPDMDVSRFRSAVIWSDAFDVLYATATFR